MLTKDPDLVSNVQVLHKFGSSDHSMVTCTIHFEHESYGTTRRIRDYCKGDYGNIRKALSEINWDQLLIGSMDDSWNTFKQLLLDLESEFIPLKQVRSTSKSKKPIWMTVTLNTIRRVSTLIQDVSQKQSLRSTVS